MLTDEFPLPKQWSLYRMKLLSERFGKYAENMEKKREHLADDYFPQVITKAQMKAFALEQIEYLTTSESALRTEVALYITTC